MGWIRWTSGWGGSRILKHADTHHSDPVTIMIKLEFVFIFRKFVIMAREFEQQLQSKA